MAASSKKEKLKSLTKELNDYRNKGLSYAAISKALNDEHHVDVSSSTVRDFFIASDNKTPKTPAKKKTAAAKTAPKKTGKKKSTTKAVARPGKGSSPDKNDKTSAELPQTIKEHIDEHAEQAIKEINAIAEKSQKSHHPRKSKPAQQQDKKAAASAQAKVEKRTNTETLRDKGNIDHDKQYFNSGYSMKKPDYVNEPAKGTLLSQGIFYVFMIASVLLLLKIIFLS